MLQGYYLCLIYYSNLFFAELLVGKIIEEQYKELHASCRWSQPSLFSGVHYFYAGLCSHSSKSTCVLLVSLAFCVHPDEL